MDPAVLETVFKNCSRREGVQKILSVETEAAVPKGQNFLSTIKRLRMKVVLGNGRIVNRTAILKDSELTSDAQTTLLRELGVFRNETMIYTSVLREMECLMEEFHCTEDVLWCRLLHHEPYSSMLLEDLKSQGFKSLLIPCYLDIDHIHIFLRSLALFHAMSKVLEERGMFCSKDFTSWYVFSTTCCRIWHSYIKEFGNVIEKKWSPHWKPIARKLQNLTVKEIEEEVMKIKEINHFNFNVLNHGDVIIPNIMFKYDWKNRPISMRFVDFQLCTYGSPAIDLTYFLNRAVQPSFYRKNFNYFIEFYHTSLLNFLDKFQFKGESPVLKDLVEDMEKLSFMGSMFFLVNYCPTENSQGEFGCQEHKDRIFKVYNRQISEEELGPGVKYFADNHLS